LQPLSARELVVVEALVGPGRGLLGRSLRQLDLPTRFAVFPLAVHRRGRNIGVLFEDEKLQIGDTVLLEGSPEAVARLGTQFDLLSLTASAERPFRRRRAPIALVVVIAIVALGAFGVLPVPALALIGAAVVMLTRCIDLDEAMASVEGRLLLLIFAMLVIGAGLEQAGSVQFVVDGLTPLLRDAPPWVVLMCIYGLTSLLTEAVTNNAVAVIITPVAATLAAELGLDPRPFVVAVMFGASASFATPIGYQTNTIVYTAGGYRFSDFLRIGVPMNIVVGATAVVLIPLFWPLT
jgi:di/tricarboxylate transporter